MSILYDQLVINNIKLYYLLMFLIILIWIGQILWVSRDISRRTQSTFFQIICIVIATLWLPVLWWLIYLMIRPSQTLEQQLGYTGVMIGGLICLHCKSENLESANYCVFCGEALKTSCIQCEYEYCIDYRFCPKCGQANSQHNRNS